MISQKNNNTVRVQRRVYKSKKKRVYPKKKRRVILRRGHYRCEWSYNKKKRKWFITVLDARNPIVHRHYEKEDRRLAIQITKHCAKTIVPVHYSKKIQADIMYLLLGGEKPEKRRKKSSVVKDNIV
jgi:mannose/fructose/N-acetylgalactosamine-specific phosphotransferase system component IID